MKIVLEAQVHFNKMHQSMMHYWPFYYHNEAPSLIVGHHEGNLQLHYNVQEMGSQAHFQLAQVFYGRVTICRALSSFSFISICLCFLHELSQDLMRDFPGNSVVKTPRSQCKAPRFDPWSGNQIPHAATKIPNAATKKDPARGNENPTCLN